MSVETTVNWEPTARHEKGKGGVDIFGCLVERAVIVALMSS